MPLTWAASTGPQGPQSRALCLHPPHCEWRPLQLDEAAALRGAVLCSLEQKQGWLPSSFEKSGINLAGLYK